ncbi:helix-hairpin-helix domain-containing protein [Mycoplasma corogypsi]|uniref:helix-hairpin-helix domain-containing protein n=1 Tax=Mycoplasma corogypsi TaxID=2106 RepID=UPI0038735A99
MNQQAIINVSKKLNISVDQTETVLNMLANGDTVPFIARYRKMVTGGLDEEQIYTIESLYKYNSELNDRKEAILKILAEKELLTDELKAKILATEVKSELEALYEPFKVGKVTKATQAIKLGLEPLAKRIFTNKDPKFNPLVEAKKYLTDEVKTVEFAIEQSNYIIAQWISQDFNIRSAIKEQILNYGSIITKVKKDAPDPDQKFKNYYDYRSPIKFIKNHNILAINRAVNLKVVQLSFDYKEQYLETIILKVIDKTRNNKNNVIDALHDSLKRLILPSVEREIFNDLFEKAEKSAIEIFSNNVEKLLLAPAIKNVNILSIDPAFANGCKLAALNENGDVLGIAKIFPNAPHKKVDEAKKITLAMLQKYKINIIVIGNGTASRETEYFIANLIKENKLDVKYAIVSEVGASVYSASKVAIAEFPDLDVQERSAINIGRKFLDPLNELVKIDPKSIGVGQYQHDLNQKQLTQYLDFKVEKVVNLVGVDINTATKEILTHIAGLTPKLAENLIEHRQQNGSFANRNEIKKVKGIGPKSFEQCIGFLRIFNSNEFLDRTFIHPESYPLAKEIIKKFNLVPTNEGIDVSSINVEEVAKLFNSNNYDVELILTALNKPLKRIENDKQGFILKDSILNMEDLKLGTKVSGTVENITDFGIFVYIGIKQSLFIHTSDLKLKNEQNLYEMFYPGMIINAEISNLDLERQRISGIIAE